jgi:hypothetical protein
MASPTALLVHHLSLMTRPTVLSQWRLVCGRSMGRLCIGGRTYHISSPWRGTFLHAAPPFWIYPKKLEGVCEPEPPFHILLG